MLNISSDCVKQIVETKYFYRKSEKEKEKKREDEFIQLIEKMKPRCIPGIKFVGKMMNSMYWPEEFGRMTKTMPNIPK